MVRLVDLVNKEGLPGPEPTAIEERALDQLQAGQTAVGRIDTDGERPPFRLFLLRRVLVHPEAVATLLGVGRLHLRGWRLTTDTGEVSLAMQTLPFELQFQDCSLDSPLSFAFAQLRSLRLRDSRFTSLDLTGATVDGDLSFVGSRGSFVCLESGRVRGGVDVSGCRLDRASASGTGDRGLRAPGLRIEGTLCARPPADKPDYGRCRIVGELDLRNAVCRGDIDLSFLTIEPASPSKDSEPAPVIRCDGLTVNGDFRLSGAAGRSDDAKPSVTGPISMQNATFKGDLHFTDQSIDGAGHWALRLDQSRVRGSVRLNRLRSGGGISIARCRIRGVLDLHGADVRAHEKNNPQGHALYASNIVCGAVYATRNVNQDTPDTPLRIRGGSDLSNSTIHGNVEFRNFDIDPASPGHADAEPLIDLSSTYVDGNVEIERGRLGSRATLGANVLSLDSSIIEGHLSLGPRRYWKGTGDKRPTEINGVLTACGTEIKGVLSLNATTLVARHRAPLLLSAVRIGRDLVIARSRIACDMSRYHVDAAAAHRLDHGGTAKLDEGIAIAAIGATIERCFVLNHGTVLEGGLDCRSSDIKLDLDFREAQVLRYRGTPAKLPDLDGCSLQLEGSRVGGTLYWYDAINPEEKMVCPPGRMNLKRATLGGLHDHRHWWPQDGKLEIEGLKYGEILQVRHPPGRQYKGRLKWLGKQPNQAFAVQPYDEFIAFCRRAGEYDVASLAAIQKTVSFCIILNQSVAILSGK